MKQQTAVQWLEDRFEKFLAYYEGHYKAEVYSIDRFLNDFQQAKQKEEEQIKQAYESGIKDASAITTSDFKHGQKYFNQTYRDDTSK